MFDNNLAIVDRFSKFFHQVIRKKILYVHIIKISTSPAICLTNQLMKEFWILVHISQSYYQTSNGLRFWNTVYSQEAYRRREWGKRQKWCWSGRRPCLQCDLRPAEQCSRPLDIHHSDSTTTSLVCQHVLCCTDSGVQLARSTGVVVEIDTGTCHHKQAVWPAGSADTVYPRPSVTLTFDRLILKLVCESHLKRGNFTSNLGTLGLCLCVLELFAMYATDGQTERQTKTTLIAHSLRLGV